MRGPPRRPHERPRRPAPPPLDHQGVFHGLRRWALHVDELGSVLHGYGGTAWNPGGEATQARCLAATPSWSSSSVAPGSTSHTAPDQDCRCGLYAHHPDVPQRIGGGRFRWANDPIYLPQGVLGVIEAWGRVELHQFGFRAQFARPIALAVHSAYVGSFHGTWLAALAERYDAICVEADDPTELAGWCEREGLGLSPDEVRRMCLGETAGGPDESCGSE